ncbi:MAG: hypothetical protein ACYTEL_19915 [Planctomycetota bacterium]
MAKAKKQAKAKVLLGVHPFTEEQEKQLHKKPIQDIREVLNALDAWRKKSLTSNIRI